MEENYFDYFMRGVMVGFDPLGTYMGSKNDDISHMGYGADKYNLAVGIFPYSVESPQSKSLSLDEMIVKDIGVAVGLVGTVTTFGLFQVMFLYSAKEKKANNTK